MALVSVAWILLCFICIDNLPLCALATRIRSIQFEKVQGTAFAILEGDRVDLSCGIDADNRIVTISNRTEDLVVHGNLMESIRDDDMLFQCNESTCTLTILKLERSHRGDYFCLYPFRYLTINVLYSPEPNSYPVCTSSFNTSSFFLREQFHFSCLSGEGNPPIKMTAYVHYVDGKIDRLSLDQTWITTNQSDHSVSLSYLPYLDSKFNHSIFVCHVTQQLPAPYQSYKKSCSFGPLVILPTFSVSIYPSRYRVNTDNNRENITLTCTSNVSGVVLEWTDIPLEDWQYNISMNNNLLQLKILNYSSDIDGFIIVQCSGSMGGRTISQYATIDTVSTNILQTVLIVSISFVILIIIVVVFILLRKRKKSGTEKNSKNKHRTMAAVNQDGKHLQQTYRYFSQVNDRSITAQQQITEQETAGGSDTYENSQFNYDQELYLVPGQNTGQEMAGDFEIYEDSQLNYDQELYLVPDQNTEQETAGNSDIFENSQLNYDQELYLVPEQNTEQEMAGVSDKCKNSQLNYDQELYLAPVQNTWQEMAGDSDNCNNSQFNVDKDIYLVPEQNTGQEMAGDSDTCENYQVTYDQELYLVPEQNTGQEMAGDSDNCKNSQFNFDQELYLVPEQNTEQEMAGGSDTYENSQVSYDQELYLVPGQNTGQEMAGDSDNCNNSQFNVDKELYLVPEQNTGQKMAGSDSDTCKNSQFNFDQELYLVPEQKTVQLG
ncbi:uncharacterized protein [Apostichopus japonicus]|uniref:uncharacterized protein n=1 Tax=Stichopus japonicus TaxID=307972 RepID=UPI003AB74C0B